MTIRLVTTNDLEQHGASICKEHLEEYMGTSDRIEQTQAGSKSSNLHSGYPGQSIPENQRTPETQE